MLKVDLLITLLFILFLVPVLGNAQVIALVSATVIDVSNFGNSEDDIEDAVILIQADSILAVGDTHTLAIPNGATLINLKGKYIVPGLVEGFGAIENQSFADAYLYMGVTSVIGIYGGRRGHVVENADPCPHIVKWSWIGRFFEPAPEELRQQLEETKSNNVKIIQFMYQLGPDQTKFAIQFAKQNYMATIGELGRTSYREAIEYGMDALVHSGRYMLDLAPEKLKDAIAGSPFGPALRQYNRWYMNLDLNDPAFQDYAMLLGESNVGLIPTLSLFGYALSDSENPWSESISAIIDSADIHNPVSRETGKHRMPPERKELVKMMAEKNLDISRELYKHGAKFLAGSGTDINGTIPGVSLHREIQLLTKVGLNNRQAIATASGNFSEIFGWKEIGTVKADSRADILVLNSNPLEDIRNLSDIDTIYLAGRRINREDILMRYSMPR